MAELSELYATDPSFSVYAGGATYQWSNPNTPSPYYQSSTLTQKGTIDQSIFAIQLMKDDPYTYGAYMTEFKENRQMNVVRNRLGKINSTPCYFTHDTAQELTGVSAGYKLAMLTDANYGLESVGYPADYTQRFYVNFQYNNYLIIGKVKGYTLNSSGFWDTYFDCDIATFELSYANAGYGYDIIEVYYVVKYNDTTISNNSMRPIYCQFAGTFDDLLLGVTTYGYNISTVGTTSGTYMFSPLTLWRGMYYYTQTRGAEGFLSGYDCSIITEWHSPRENDEGRFVIKDINTVITMFDRLGVNWSKSVNSLTSKLGTHCDDPNVRCPVLDIDNGNLVTTEVYSGTQLAEYAMAHPDCNYNWDYGADDRNGKTFAEVREEYAQPEQPTTEPADEINLNEPVIATSGGNSVWLMNEQKLKEFFTFLWDPNGSAFDDIVHACALFGENPMDSVVSCRFFPLDLGAVFDSKFDSQYRKIVFGRYPSTVTARLLTSSNVAIYELGSFYFNDSGMFNDFRDYEPYSQYSIYIPFVGIISVSAIECINTTLSIKMIIDIVTGACTAVVFTNGVPYKYLDGMIGIEVPVTGRAMGQYGQQILGAALGGIGAGLAMGNKTGAFSAASSLGAEGTSKNMSAMGHNVANMSFGGASSYGMSMGASALGHGAAALTSAALPAATVGAFALGGAVLGGAMSALVNNPAPQSAGSNVPAMGLAKPLYPYFIVQRSDSWIPENYNKLYGRFLQRGGKVGDFLGFSTFGNVNVDNITHATNNEKVLITKLLTKGVYL